MADIKYKKLYKIQDRILDIMFQSQSIFYLTGGTCLNRFNFNKRYSDDLDLFTSENALYREEVRIVLDELKNYGILINLKVDTRDFVRFTAESVLQVDMVNDRVYRHGRSLKNELGYRIDNLENIAANKITAVISRDEPKDVFDLHTIACNLIFTWAEILQIADKKTVLDREILEYRLKSFPVDLVNDLSVVEQGVVKQFQKEYPVLLKDIINERENSLTGRKS